MRGLRLITWWALLVLVPTAARGQAGSFFEKVVTSVENAGGFWTYAGFMPNSSVFTAGPRGAPPKMSGLQGPGFVITLSVGTAGKQRWGHHRPDQKEHDAEAPTDSGPAWAFHVALAYSQLTGFHAQNPTYDVLGSIREFPRIAWFAEWRPRRRISPYFGLHTGLVQLQSTAIYDSSGAYYPFAGSTWELGGAVGLVANVHAGPTQWIGFFVEPGYTLRDFPSLDWGSQKTIPARFPRSLRFSGWEIAAGMALSAPPRPAGQK